MGTGAWITGGGLLVLAGLVFAVVRGWRSATRAQAQAERDRSAIENAEERNKVEDKAAHRGPGWARGELRRWVRRP